VTLAKISVIIPTLNESVGIQRSIESIGPGLEVIVVDGGSMDDTLRLAEALGARTLKVAGGRAAQMNAGAQVAIGDILLFLHGDTQLPEGFGDLIHEALQDKSASPCGARSAIAGAFYLQIDAPLRQLRWVEYGVNWRSRVLQMPYGDQGIFLRSATFRQVGGFPEQPIMEDFELMRRLQRLGEITIIPIPVVTSARRWLQRGILRTTLINQLVILGYFLGVDTQCLKKLYRQSKSCKP
jgi:rSAM/selenodomain-associated transferase 2